MIAELKKRVAALSRLGKQVRMGNVKDVKDSDLWVLYMMLIENGKFAFPYFLSCINSMEMRGWSVADVGA